MMAQWGQILAGRDQPNPKKSAKLILSRSSKTPRPKIESQNDHSLKPPNKQRTTPWNVNEFSMTCTTGQLEGLNGKISLCFGIGMGPAIMMTPAFTKRSLLTRGQWWPSNSDNPAFYLCPKIWQSFQPVSSLNALWNPISSKIALVKFRVGKSCSIHRPFCVVMSSTFKYHFCIDRSSDHRKNLGRKRLFPKVCQ